MEATGKLVVDAALGHPPQRRQDLVAGVRVVVGDGVLQQQGHEEGLGELGRAAEAAELLVVALHDLRGGGATGGGGVGALRPWLQRAGRLLQVRGDLAGLPFDGVAPLPVGGADGVQHLPPGGHPLPRHGWEVRPAEERPAIGKTEHVQRPAALAAHELHGVHVDLIDVGALLAVDLDADKEARSGGPPAPRPRTDSRSITWHQWQAA